LNLGRVEPLWPSIEESFAFGVSGDSLVGLGFEVEGFGMLFFGRYFAPLQHFHIVLDFLIQYPHQNICVLFCPPTFINH
jgi:hypothetical protein